MWGQDTKFQQKYSTHKPQMLALALSGLKLSACCCQTAHVVITFVDEKHKLEHRKECGTQGVTGNLFRGCCFLY